MTMKSVDLAHLRSVVLAGHAGAGKTTLAEQLLFRAGAVPRLGKVDDGSAHLDFEPEEQKRHESLSLAVASAEYEGTRLVFVDTPGFEEALRILEAVSNSFLIPVSDRLFRVVRDTAQKRNEMTPDMSLVVPVPGRISVQEAQEMIRCAGFSSPSFTPMTIIASISSRGGTQRMTLFAPRSRCFSSCAR